MSSRILAAALAAAIAAPFAVTALVGTAAPARASFDDGEAFADLTDYLDAHAEDEDGKKAKAVAKALAGISKKDSQGPADDLKIIAKVVKTLAKVCADDEELQTIVDDILGNSDLDTTFLIQAGVGSYYNYLVNVKGWSPEKAAIKTGKTNVKLAKNLAKAAMYANASSLKDQAKRTKFLAKAAKAAEKLLDKYGQEV